MKNVHIEQKNFNKESTLLELCCQKVLDKFGGTHNNHLKNSDYIRLSGQIKKETKIHISTNTLKRLLGKLNTTERYYPQKATRDALAKYIGLENWEEFESIHLADKSAEFPLQEDTQTTTSTANRGNIKKTYIKIFVLFLFLIAASLIIWHFRKNNTRSQQNATLICINPKGTSPHSAIFKLATEEKVNFNNAEYTISFRDWKRGKDLFSDSTMTYYYEIPGVYYPTLLYKNKVIDTSLVYLQTVGWEVTAQSQYDTTRVFPIMGLKKDSNPIPKVDIKDILSSGVDTLRTFFTIYSYIKPTTISGDNMHFAAFVSTSPERPGVRCSKVDITIFGEHDYHYLSIMKPACSTWSYYKFSELGQSGQSSDLRAINHDLSQGGKIDIQIKNKNVKMFINEKEVLNTSYKTSIGKVLGVNITFSGIGRFSDYKLSSF
ncbi:hypothetical protein [Sphingobacterium sp.]|uniref:hypothetical protein n=1 Tax=Sphingobacterium sp. TaxID=341027 RepID=UPI0031CF35B8